MENAMTGRCFNCGKEYKIDWTKKKLRTSDFICTSCNGDNNMTVTIKDDIKTSLEKILNYIF